MMSGQNEIRLASVKITGQQDIDLLIEAANDIQSATEANFKQMKEKRWYNRLWEIATFSKDNIKVVAKNTASLAQMQDIILRVILILSKESVKLSNYLDTHSQQLLSMAKGQVKLADAITKIKYGHEQRPDINDMQMEHQYVIVSAAFKFVDKTCSEQHHINSSVQQYLRNLRNCCESGLNPEASAFDYIKIDSLNAADGHKLLAVILCELDILLEGDSVAAFDEIIRYVSISSIELEKIKGRVAEYARMMGKEFIAVYYENNDVINNLPIVGGEWVEVTGNEEPNKEKPTSNTGSFTLPPDDTAAQFPELREIVLKQSKNINTKGRDVQKRKSIDNFIEKHSLNVAVESAIAIIDTSIIGNGKEGLLFTTYAMYYKYMFEEIVKINYCDIVHDKCSVEYDKKGKPFNIKVVKENAETITIVCSANGANYLNAASLMTMLAELGKLSEFAPTDSPIPISEMGYSEKLPFIKYMVNFMVYSKLPTIELMRYACDAGFTDEQLSELARYIADPKESDENLLLQINSNAPYGSRKSLKYALIMEMYDRLQITKGSSDESLLEHEFIRKTALLYGFNDEDLKNMKVVAQAKYKIITGQIKTVKELKAVEKALTGLALTGEIPLSTVIGSSLLFWKSMWFLFIPGIGTIIGTAIAGIGIAMAIINKNKNDAKLSEQRDEMIASEKKSYRSAIDRLSRLFPGMVIEIKLLEKTSYHLTGT